MADAELALILARAPDWYVSDIDKGAGRGRMGAERTRGVADEHRRVGRNAPRSE
jgi:hypothetical protein